MDREDWWASVPGVTKSQTQPKGLNTHTPYPLLEYKVCIIFSTIYQHRTILGYRVVTVNYMN